VIIDEAHHFRNPGRQGDADEEVEPSRYYQLYSCSIKRPGPKLYSCLPQQPINNRLSDFRHMTELFTRRDEAYFAARSG